MYNLVQAESCMELECTVYRQYQKNRTRYSSSSNVYNLASATLTYGSLLALDYKLKLRTLVA